MLSSSESEGSKIPYALIVFLVSLGLIYAGWSSLDDANAEAQTLDTDLPEWGQRNGNSKERPPSQLSCYDCGMQTEPKHCELLPAGKHWPQIDKHLGYCYTDQNPYPGDEWRLETNVWDDSKNPLTSVPPRLAELDDSLISEYTLGGRTLIQPQYFSHVAQNNTAGGSMNGYWQTEFIETAVEDVISGKKAEIGSYGPESHNLFATMQKYEKFVKNKLGTVIGSQRPWVEIYSLAAGAKMLTTIEYTILDTDIPMVRRLHPSEVPDEFYAGSLHFDFAVSFSSLEHSGLGRYGDPIDPAGDLKAMAQISCMVKPGGLLFLAVPFGLTDCVKYNAHRIYGPVRIPYMLENWRFIDFTGTEPAEKTCKYSQGVMVLQNMRSCSNGWNS